MSLRRLGDTNDGASRREHTASTLSPRARIHKADLNTPDWSEPLRSLLPARNLLGDGAYWGLYLGRGQVANHVFNVLQHQGGSCIQHGS